VISRKEERPARHDDADCQLGGEPLAPLTDGLDLDPLAEPSTLARLQKQLDP
jgi:hypothetical protein